MVSESRNSPLKKSARPKRSKTDSHTGHGHHHRPANYNAAFAIGVVLNMAFVIIEAGYGFVADSLALVSDAGHNLSDVVSLLLAWGANFLGRRKATDKRTYGYKRVSILASTISATLLIFALGGITWEAVQRLEDPRPVDAATLIIVAGIGTVINTLTALLFLSGQKHDLNLRAAYLHMLADAAISIGVVISGVLIFYTGRTWIDPAVSLIIVLVILSATWGLLRESINLSLDAVPRAINLPEVRHYLQSLQEVSAIHDLHVWAMSTTETALTVHLVMSDAHVDNRFLHQVTSALHDRFAIQHSTIQLEEENPAYSAHDTGSCANHPDPTPDCR